MLGAAGLVCQDDVTVAVDLIEAIRQLPLFAWGLQFPACGIALIIQQCCSTIVLNFSGLCVYATFVYLYQKPVSTWCELCCLATNDPFKQDLHGLAMQQDEPLMSDIVCYEA